MQLRNLLQINLYWRTFLFLVILQLLSSFTWMVIYSNINQNTNSSIFQNSDWVYWIAVAIVPSLLCAAVIANLINKPLELLSKAANRVRIGDFTTFRLDESVPIAEIQNVYRGFNQMSDQLSKIETNRTVMLAGISHDIRTPLARLRLESELSVNDAEF